MFQCRPVHPALTPNLTVHHSCHFIWVSRKAIKADTVWPLPVSLGYFLLSLNLLHFSFKACHNASQCYLKGSTLPTLYCLPRRGQVWVLASLVLQRTTCKPSVLPFSWLAPWVSMSYNLWNISPYILFSSECHRNMLVQLHIFIANLQPNPCQVNLPHGWRNNHSTDLLGGWLLISLAINYITPSKSNVAYNKGLYSGKLVAHKLKIS